MSRKKIVSSKLETNIFSLILSGAVEADLKSHLDDLLSRKYAQLASSDTLGSALRTVKIHRTHPQLFSLPTSTAVLQNIVPSISLRQ